MTTETLPEAAADAARTDLLVPVAEAFERAWLARQLPAPEGPRAAWIAGQRAMLGPTAVWRTARRLAGPRWTDRFVNTGVRITPPAGAARPAALDAAAPCELAARALVALACGQRELALGVRADRELAAAALAPALERGAIELVDGSDLATGTAVFVIAPYYYSPSDLERLVWQVVLEALEPCPTSEDGVTVMTPSGWDQRRAFEERVTAQLEAAKHTRREVRFVTLDADDSEGVLRAAREAVQKLEPLPDALSVFVYPMRRETPATEKALMDLLGEAPLATLNTRTSAAWAAGVGPLAGTRRVEHHQMLHLAPPPASAEQRVRYEKAPSFGGALRLATSAWVRAVLA